MTLSRRLTHLERQEDLRRSAEPEVFDIFYRDTPDAPLRFDRRIPEGTPMNYPGEVSRLIISYEERRPALQSLVQPKGNDDE